MQIFTCVYSSRKLPVRVLCALLMVSIGVLVYYQDVHAAGSYQFILTPSGYSSTNGWYVTKANASFLNDYQEYFRDVTGGSSVFKETYVLYDISIPFYLKSSSSVSGIKYASFNCYNWINFNLSTFTGSTPQCSLTFLDCYVDSDNVSLRYDDSSTNPDFLSFNSPVAWQHNYVSSFSLSVDDLRFNGSYSDVFYIHFIFFAVAGSNYNLGHLVLMAPQRFNFSFGSIGSPNVFDDSVFIGDDTEIGKLQDIEDTIKQEHQEEIDKGSSSGDDASGMTSDLTNHVKSKWEILFYPIEFTKKFLALFTGSSGGSTSIQFPAFSMEVGGTSYQVWDAYTFDLASLKSDFSLLFNGIHLVVGTIEVTAFIKYLYRKYDEVFGGGG